MVISSLTNECVEVLQDPYVRLLNETALFVLAEQEQAREGVGTPTEFVVGSFALMLYLVHLPSKLAARWSRPYRIVKREANNAFVEDLTDGTLKTVDVSRLKPFFVTQGVDPKAIAAADLGEAQAEVVLAHTGTGKKRSDLQVQIQWSDGDVTWEPWDRGKNLAEVEDCIRSFSGTGLKRLIG